MIFDGAFESAVGGLYCKVVGLVYGEGDLGHARTLVVWREFFFDGCGCGGPADIGQCAFATEGYAGRLVFPGANEVVYREFGCGCGVGHGLAYIADYLSYFFVVENVFEVSGVRGPGGRRYDCTYENGAQMFDHSF